MGLFVMLNNYRGVSLESSRIGSIRFVCSASRRTVPPATAALVCGFSFSSLVLLLQALLKALICSPPSQSHVNCLRNRHVLSSTLFRRLLAESVPKSWFSAVLSLSRLDKINDWLGPRKEPNGLVPAQVSGSLMRC
jgi:hypothetical protein